MQARSDCFVSRFLTICFNFAYVFKDVVNLHIQGGIGIQSQQDRINGLQNYSKMSHDGTIAYDDFFLLSFNWKPFLPNKFYSYVHMYYISLSFFQDPSCPILRWSQREPHDESCRGIQESKDACRDITKLIKRTPGTTVDIPIDVCEMQVKLRKPIRGVKVWWPVIRMGSWCQYLLRRKPLLLGGHAVAGNWVCGDHPIFGTSWTSGLAFHTTYTAMRAVDN